MIRFGIPIVISPLLGREDFYFFHKEQVLYASPGAARWLMLYAFAAGWPVRDVAAADEF